MRISKDNVRPLFESPYLNVADLQFAEGQHYYSMSRRPVEDIVAIKSDKDFKAMFPDAVSCIVILELPGGEELLLAKEYRYPAGRYLLSVPAGLIDKEDLTPEALNLIMNDIPEGESMDEDTLWAEVRDTVIRQTAVREIREETGLAVSRWDRLKIVNRALFSTPGITDETNALVCAVLWRDMPGISCLTQDGAVGTELFNGFVRLTKDEARQVLKDGTDAEGNFYPLHTFAALLYFVSDMWLSKYGED